MKKRFLILFACFAATAVYSQEPLHWDFSAKKTAEGKYEIHLKTSIQEPWHTYSQTTPDGGPLPTKIVFTKNPLVKTEGKIKEIGELKTTHDETFGVDVKYFAGSVDFVQSLTVRKGIKTKITGTVEFMACNDRQCLPPRTIPFIISL